MAAVPIMTEAEAMDVFRIAPPQRPSQDLIALRDLSIDPRYQREIAEGDVRRIARTFDELAFGVVYVSERIDRYTGTATYAIIDGQHRVEAARRARSEDWRAPVFVYRNLTPEQEAALFVVMNGKRTAVSPLRQFKAELFAGMPDAVAINEIVESIGLRISLNGAPGVDAIVAVSALRAVYRYRTTVGQAGRARLHSAAYADGAELLRVTLRVMRAAWHPNEGAYSGDAIRGVARFLLHYGGLVDHQRLVNAMRRDGPSLMYQRARTLRDIHREAKETTFARILLSSYNHGLRSQRLPEWGTATTAE